MKLQINNKLRRALSLGILSLFSPAVVTIATISAASSVQHAFGADVIFNTPGGFFWESSSIGQTPYTQGSAVTFDTSASRIDIIIFEPVSPSKLNIKGSNMLGLSRLSGSTIHVDEVNLTGHLSIQDNGVFSDSTTILMSQGSKLNLNGNAIVNNVTASGGSLSGFSAYAGALSVTGAVSVADTITGNINIANTGNLTLNSCYQ